MRKLDSARVEDQETIEELSSLPVEHLRPLDQILGDVGTKLTFIRLFLLVFEAPFGLYRVYNPVDSVPGHSQRNPLYFFSPVFPILLSALNIA